MIIRIYIILPIYLQVFKTKGIREKIFNTFPENITYVFENKASFIKLEIKSKCSYYLEARKNKQNLISNLIT